MKNGILLSAACLMLTSCATFALSYQNYFTKNFAYVASSYTGNPSKKVPDGAESNDFEDGNEKEYSASKFATLLFGFRSLEHHNSQYTSGGSMNETIVGTFIPPQKGDADAVTFVTLEMSGSNINAKPGIPQAKAVTILKQTYPALMVTIDNKALQAASGSGMYTIVWKSLKSGGKAESRELSRVSTNLQP